MVVLLFVKECYICFLFNSFCKFEIYILVYYENRRKEKKKLKLDIVYKYIVLWMFYLCKDLLMI